MTVKRLATAVSLAASALVVILLLTWFLVLRDPRRSQTVAYDGTTVTVEADLGGGELKHAVLPDTGPMLYAKPLTRAVRLTVDGGELRGTGRLSFTVPDGVAVPAGQRIEDLVVIATRDEGADAVWDAVDSTFDAGTRTMSTEVTHLSDWVLSIVDPAVIARNLAAQKSATGNYASKWLAESLIGKWQPPACTDKDVRAYKRLPELRLVPVRIYDPARPQLAVCMGYLTKADPDLGRSIYYLEVANPHDFPIVMDLPSSVVKLDDANAGTKLFRDLYREITEDPDEARFQPREKRTFKVKQGELAAAYEMKGTLDYTTYLVDLAVTLFDLAGAEGAGKVKGEKGEAIAGSVKSAENLSCLNSAAEEHEGEMHGLRDKATAGRVLDAVKDLVQACLDQVLDKAKGLLEKLDKAARFAKGSIRKALNAFLKTPDLADALREFMAVTGRGWRDAYGLAGAAYRPVIDLRPYLANYGRVLPPPSKVFVSQDGNDPREVLTGATSSDFRFPDSCTRGGVRPPEAGWFVGTAAGPVVGVANYDLYEPQGEFDPAYLAFGVFTVVEIKPGFEARVATYLNGTLDTCANDVFSYKAVPGVALAKGADAKWMLEDRAGSSGGYVIKATSGKWLLQASIQHNGLARMSIEQMRPFVDDVMISVFEYASAVTGTPFARQ